MKLIRKDHTHNGFIFREGFNSLEDTDAFYASPCSVPNYDPLERGYGFYFCKEEDIVHWLFETYDEIGYIATVTLCPDSVCVSMDEEHRLSTDRFILGSFQPFEEFVSVERAEQIVRTNGRMLQYISINVKTAELCQAAVQQTGWALEHVPVELRTAPLCLAAVQHAGGALEHVPEELRTATLCLAAVQQWGWALEHVPEELRTAALCLAAVQQSGEALEFVPEELRTIALYRISCTGLGDISMVDDALLMVDVDWRRGWGWGWGWGVGAYQTRQAPLRRLNESSESTSIK